MFKQSSSQAVKQPNLTGFTGQPYTRQGAARWRSLLPLCMLCGLLVTGLSPSVRAQQPSITIDSQKVYQLIDICRLKVVFRADPGTVITYSFQVELEIDGENQGNYLEYTSLPDGSTTLSITQSRPYIDNLRAVADQSRTDATEPFNLTLYFTLPRSAPTSEFVFVSDPFDLPTQAYSIAQHCPKGN